MEIIKPIIKVGNSAGVLLPREWLNGKAKITLIEKPVDLKKEILEILDKYMENIMAIAVVGSYARGEQTAESDVDVLAITNSINKRIEKGKYEIILVSQNKLQKYLNGNILPLLPMIIEAKALINKELIKRYKNTKLTRKNLLFHFKTTKSAMKVVKAGIDLALENGEENCADAVAYSLVLRLRELYIIECLIKGKLWSKKVFLQLLKQISGSLRAYDGYLRIKNNKTKEKNNLPLEEAKKLHDYINDKIREQEKEWVKIKE